MTSRAQIEQMIDALYVARVQGNVDETIKNVAEDATMLINAKGVGLEGLGTPIRGRAAIRSAVAKLIEDWRFADWQRVDLVVEGEKAMLHWRAHVTCVPTSKSEVFDCFDVITFRDGQMVDLRQSTDTALMMRLAS